MTYEQRKQLHELQEQRKQKAVDFINSIREMSPEALNALIVREAGEPLGQFFLNYSATLISKDPTRVIENTSSLMLMGYLIRAMEERPLKAANEQGATQPPALA